MFKISSLPKPVFFDEPPQTSLKRKAEEVNPLFESPLSKEALKKRRENQVTNSQNPSFIGSRSIGINEQTLKKLYDIDFIHPPKHANIENFFLQLDLLIQIEEKLNNIFSNFDLARIRERIKFIILSDSPFEKKMAELGTFLYFSFSTIF